MFSQKSHEYNSDKIASISLLSLSEEIGKKQSVCYSLLAHYNNSPWSPKYMWQLGSLYQPYVLLGTSTMKPVIHFNSDSL